MKKYTKEKITILLFVIFILFYVATFNTSAFVLSFLGVSGLILLQKSTMLKNQFNINLQPVIVAVFIIFGLLYFKAKYLPRETFKNEIVNSNQDTINPAQDKKTSTRTNISNEEKKRKSEVLSIADQLKKELTDLKQNMDNLKKEATKSKEVQGTGSDKLYLNLKDTDSLDVEFSLYKRKQDLEFLEKKYKVQQELEQRNKLKKVTLEKKNILLLRKTIIDTLSQIISETVENVENVINNNTEQNIYDRFLLLVEEFLKSCSKEGRMLHVGIIFIVLSFAFTLIEISL